MASLPCHDAALFMRYVLESCESLSFQGRRCVSSFSTLSLVFLYCFGEPHCKPVPTIRIFSPFRALKLLRKPDDMIKKELNEVRQSTRSSVQNSKALVFRNARRHIAGFNRRSTASFVYGCPIVKRVLQIHY